MIGYYNKYPFLLKINNLDRFENCFGIKTGRIKMADFSGYFRLFSVIFEKYSTALLPMYSTIFK